MRGEAEFVMQVSGMTECECDQFPIECGSLKRAGFDHNSQKTKPHPHSGELCRNAVVATHPDTQRDESCHRILNTFETHGSTTLLKKNADS